jgi:hypothetical protein
MDNPNNFWTGFIHSFIHHQGPEHMPQMHRNLKAYCATLLTPLILDIPTFAARCLHVHSMREIKAAKGGTLWGRILSRTFA